MVLTEETILEMLSKSEATVYEYIKERAIANGDSLKQSMKDIGDELSLSEATVHRSIRKLRKQGIIGIVPSMEKAESNEIIYYGAPDPDKQVSEIFQMIGELSSSANRFETILQSKDQRIDSLMRDQDLLYERIDQLELELSKSRAENSGLDMDSIISSQPLGDGTTAYIIKNS